MEGEFISIDGVAAEYSVSRSTAWKWIRDNEIETYRFIGDRKTYVRREDVQRLREPIRLDPAKKEPAAHKLVA
jgi:excisionase family DNA binding protein